MSFIQDWDSGQPNAFWDVGLQWDVNISASTGQVNDWLKLITSEYNQQPNFMAMVATVLQPIADSIAVCSTIPELYDLDHAVASQLDADGQWIGPTRFIAVPLTGVFFSWATPGLGWLQANWTSGIAQTQLVELPDANYRTLLYATIGVNHWDGTIPQAYTIWNELFQGNPGLLIQDKPGMHMDLALTGTVPDAVTRALFTGGYLNFKPAGVQIDNYYTPFKNNVPYFAFGTESANLAGWGVGYWGIRTPGN